MADDEGVLRVNTTPAPNAPDPPAIAAAFLVKFDHRKGYVLTWHKAIEGLQIEGDVELKSLPSGLHNVEQDLVYFTHDDYVGVSAYINKPNEQAVRNASMLSVGVLVPLQHGRMGKSWLHAEGLKAIASKMIHDGSDTSPLEQYWEEHRLQPSRTPAPPEESTDDLFIPKKGSQDNANGYQKFRSMSTGSTFTPGMHTLAAHHPAVTLMEFLDVLGPLMFPLYRAAILRKRVLIVTEAPVEFACNIVYNLSILSSIPKALLQLLPQNTSPLSLRRRPLYTVGVTDIPLLSQPSSDGWIACTTDDVLATKPECFDVLVLLPSSTTFRSRQKRTYPRIIISSPDLSNNFPRKSIKATQRDAERYTILREGLRNFPASIIEPTPQELNTNATALVEDDGASTLSTTSTVQDHNQIVEPPSWSQVAYTSLVWWASAGDTRAGLTEAEQTEREIDLSLLEAWEDGDDERTKEIVLVGVFRRLTALLFEGVAGMVRAAEGDSEAERYRDDDDAEEENTLADENTADRPEPSSISPSNTTDEQPLLLNHQQEQILEITSEDISSIGLDMWSSTDRKFIVEFLDIWYEGREGRVRGGGIECCGVRIM